MSEKWTPYKHTNLPRKDSSVEWIAPSGEVVRGKYLGGVVWMPEGSEAYVYYVPVFWRYLEQ